MKLWALGLGVLAAAAQTACSQNASITSGCAKTQAIAVETDMMKQTITSGLHDIPGYPGIKYGTLPGGILTLRSQLSAKEAQELKVPADFVKEQRCTFSIGVKPSASNIGLQPVLWTADHCIVPNRNATVLLEIWVPSEKRYEQIEAQLDPLLAYSDIEKKTSHFPEASQVALFQYFKTAVEKNKDQSTAVCKSATAQIANPSKFTTVCTSLSDVGAYRFNFVGKPSAALQNHLNVVLPYMSTLQMNLKDLVGYGGTKLKVTPAQVEMTSKWTAYSLEISSIKSELPFASLAEDLGRCGNSTDSEFPGKEEICAQADELRKIEAIKKHIDESTETGVGAASRIAAKILSMQGEMSIVVDAFLADENIASLLMIGSNWSFVKSFSGIVNNVVLDSSTAGGFGAVIAKTLDPSGKIQLFTPLINNLRTTMVVNFPLEIKPAQFMPGDSGTTSSLIGVLPMFTLSTVDGNPTTGGMSLKKLPESKETKGNGQTGSAESKKDVKNNKTARNEPNCAF